MTTLSFSEYRRKSLGCWLGKAVGGTLGGPFEGHEGFLDLHYYEPVPERMLPNDDLDLQVVWLEAIRRNGLPIHPRLLADAWLRHIELWCDEYGVACRNMVDGIFPPVSGAFDNGFTDGMGAAIRTELWACIAPGNPKLAVEFATMDAVADHAGEGVYAACFLAALESLAFVESDPNQLIDQALTFIPADSRISRAIQDTRQWLAASGDWRIVRQQITAAYGNQNFTDVAPNLAFTVLGWLAGKDFGDRLCIAVNCGMDTDCTGATLGSLLGILDPDSISDEWLRPIGRDLVLSPGMVGMHAPKTLDAFTDSVAGLAVAVSSYYPSSLGLSDVPDNLPAPAASDASLSFAGFDWSDGCTALISVEPVPIRLVYPPSIAFAPGVPAEISLLIEDPSSWEVDIQFPDGWEGKRFSGENRYLVTAPPAVEDRAYDNSIDIVVRRAGEQFSWRLTAGLPITTPWLVNGVAVEAIGSRFPLPAEAATLIADIKLPYTYPVKFVAQTGHFAQPSASLRAVSIAVDGKVIHTHQGTRRVPAIHRSEGTGKIIRLERGWHRIEVMVAAGEPMDFYFAVADGDTWQWLRSVEWRAPTIE